MKKLIFVVGGACAAAVGWLVWRPRHVEPVVELAHQLENAWEDHHTSA